MSRSPALRRRWSAAAVVPLVAVAALLGGCAPPPGLSVRTVASGLTLPWDLAFTPDGSMLFTERAGVVSIRHADGRIARVSADLSDLFVGSETGLMGIVVDPAFSTNRRVLTCQGRRSTAGNDIRVVVWSLAPGGESMTQIGPLVSGLPVTSGRHGGCRLRFDPEGHLWVGTGDAAVGTNAQDLESLGGKVLRVDRFSGAGLPDNPLASSTSANRRRLWSWGHRNVQGLALHPGDSSMWTVEHGTDRDDEINQGVAGNFGWDPVPGYDESRPMTDTTKFPDAVRASYSTGFPTTATSGATWLSGAGWKGWDGTLAVANLKDSSLRIFRRDGSRLVPIATVLDGTYGRLRTAQLGPNGRLYVTTSNGGGNDLILEVTPG